MRPTALAALLSLTACVPRARYNNAVNQLDETRQLVMLQQVAMAQMEAEVDAAEARCGHARPSGPPPVQPSTYQVQQLGIPALLALPFQAQSVAMAVLNAAPAPCKACVDQGKSAATCLIEAPQCANMPRVTARVIDMARRGHQQAAITEAIRYDAPWVAVPAGDSPALGAADAPITIVMFLEVQCPYCVRGSATMDELAQRYGDRLRLVYKHFPLAFHDQAKPAAIAMEAARRQGRFWEYKAALYARASELRSNAELMAEVAEQVGLNMNRYLRDIDDPTTAAQVDADMEQGTALGVTGTPAFFVNGYGLRGAQPAEKFAALIDRELGE